MPNHSSASLVKFYRPEFQAQIAMNIIREYLGYPTVGEFFVLISVNKFPTGDARSDTRCELSLSLNSVERHFIK
jgi:hypothetical protein